MTVSDDMAPPPFDVHRQIAVIDEIKVMVRPAVAAPKLKLIKGGRDG